MLKKYLKCKDLRTFEGICFAMPHIPTMKPLD